MEPWIWMPTTHSSICRQTGEASHFADWETNQYTETAHAQSLSCPTFWDSMDCSPPGSSVQGIFQARILEGIVIFSSRGSSQPRDWTCVSCIGRQILYTKPPGSPIQKLDSTKTKIKTQRLLHDQKLMESGVVMKFLFYSQFASPRLLLHSLSIILHFLTLVKGNQSSFQSKRIPAGGKKTLLEVDQSLTSPLSFFHTQTSWFQIMSNTSWFLRKDVRKARLVSAKQIYTQPILYSASQVTQW